MPSEYRTYMYPKKILNGIDGSKTDRPSWLPELGVSVNHNFFVDANINGYNNENKYLQEAILRFLLRDEMENVWSIYSKYSSHVANANDKLGGSVWNAILRAQWEIDQVNTESELKKEVIDPLVKQLKAIYNLMTRGARRQPFFGTCSGFGFGERPDKFYPLIEQISLEKERVLSPIALESTIKYLESFEIKPKHLFPNTLTPESLKFRKRKCSNALRTYFIRSLVFFMLETCGRPLHNLVAEIAFITLDDQSIDKDLVDKLTKEISRTEQNRMSVEDLIF